MHEGPRSSDSTVGSGSLACVFGDLNERLPQEARDFLDAMQPAESASASECASAYARMDDWLRENRKWVFASATSPCSSHKGRCPVAVGGVPAFGSAAASVPADNDTEGTQCGGTPLRGNVVGIVCVGWSSMGSEKGFGDKSERPHAI